MTILWIEDQPDEHEAHLFPAHQVDGRRHILIKTSSFDDAYDKVSMAAQEYDFVVIDINLEHFALGQHGARLMGKFRLSEQDFLGEAGFHLYLRLLQSGFMQNRMIFLTAYTPGNQFDTLSRKLDEARFQHDATELNNIFQEIEEAVAESPDDIAQLQAAFELYEQPQHSLVNVYELLDRLAEAEEARTEVADAFDNRYGKFYKRFKAARLVAAKAIKKTRYEDFHRWLNRRLNSQYNHDFRQVILRRGIIQGCRELRQRLEQIPERHLAGDLLFYHTTNIVPAENQRQYVCDYLTRLEYFFPLNFPRDPQYLYRLFLKELSADWELSGQDYFPRRFKQHYNFSELEFRFKSNCQSQMKLLRNWSVHNLLSTALTEQDVAYLFMIAMRGWFNLSVNEILIYEQILFDLFTPGETIPSDITPKLAESYHQLRDLLHHERFRQNPYGHEFKELVRMVENLSDRRRDDVEAQRALNRELSMRLFYQHYWHGLFPAYLEICGVKQSGSSVSMCIKFRDCWEETIQDVLFLDFLGQAIWKRTWSGDTQN